MELRWYVQEFQEGEDGPYKRHAVLQYRLGRKYEWANIEEEFGPDILYDGTER